MFDVTANAFYNKSFNRLKNFNCKIFLTVWLNKSTSFFTYKENSFQEFSIAKTAHGSFGNFRFQFVALNDKRQPRSDAVGAKSWVSKQTFEIVWLPK